MKERTYLRIALLIPALLTFYFIFQIFEPFLLPIILAIVLVTLCYPVYDWISARLNGRESLAALLTCTLLTVVIIVPVLVLVIMLAGEISSVYQNFQNLAEQGYFEEFQLEQQPYFDPYVGWIREYVDFDQIDLMGSLTSALQQASVFFLRYSSQILSGILGLVTSFFIMLVTMFFLFRDGGRLTSAVRSLTPLSVQMEERLTSTFREVTRATIVGSLATALAQGVAGAIVFAVLGISNIVFWGSMMALFSLVPVIGTALVWGPWAIYFLATGAYIRAGILIVLAAGLIGLIDNVLRPLLIEGRSGMHTLLVFFSIMGGISYFGLVGMIFGPIIVALGLTFVELFRVEFREVLNKPGP